MTGAAPTFTVREILVVGIMWWVEGRNWAETPPDLARRFTPEQLDALYDAIAKVEREVGQPYLEWLMGHLADHDGGPDPEVPTVLLETARDMYASAVQGT